MLLMTVVCDNSREDIIEDIKNMVECFRNKNINIGMSESLQDSTHFVKILCGDEDCNASFINSFNINMANVMYKSVIDEFYKKEMQRFIMDTYFFLRYDEIKEIKDVSLEALKNEGPIVDEYSVFCMNRKNDIIEKIATCIKENSQINIQGFITFRMKELMEDMESIIDRVVEKYMVEKEYNEFIKLLTYFVDIQECKIEEVNIVIKEDGSYTVHDKYGTDIMDKFLSDLSDSKFSGVVSMDDMLISGLVTNAPAKVVIHCAENCTNKELIDTIKNVFMDRVVLCDSCKICREIKKTTKV